jgi:two-component system, chemotaxis family, chemotaxis protein CheY
MKRILAVDDSRTLREMLFDCLTGAGHEVFTARDGAEGLAALRAHRPDIVITDLNMPVMDGLDFIEAARADDAGRGVPLLLLTTETAGELKLRARKIGATGWLTKPFNEAQILGLIDQLA